jgi:ribosomal protein L13
LGRAIMGKLFVYAGAEHPHAAQLPVKFDTSAIRRG